MEIQLLFVIGNNAWMFLILLSFRPPSLPKRSSMCKAIVYPRKVVYWIDQKS